MAEHNRYVTMYQRTRTKHTKKEEFMAKDVAVIGVGQSSFVRGYEGSIRELAFEAFREAMQDADLTTKDVDASIFCSAPEYDKQRSPAGVLAEYLGLIPQPTFYVETVCSSSSSGVKIGYSMIKAGLHDVVVVSVSRRCLRLPLPNRRKEWAAAPTFSGKPRSAP